MFLKIVERVCLTITQPHTQAIGQLHDDDIFDYNYQNLFRFALLFKFVNSAEDLKNNSLNLHKKTTNSRILVVVVK